MRIIPSGNMVAVWPARARFNPAGSLDKEPSAEAIKASAVGREWESYPPASKMRPSANGVAERPNPASGLGLAPVPAQEGREEKKKAANTTIILRFLSIVLF